MSNWLKVLVYIGFWCFYWYICGAQFLVVVNLCDFGLILVGCVPRLCPMDNKFMEGFFMNRFRDVKNDLIREWLDFREENNFGCVLRRSRRLFWVLFQRRRENLLRGIWICWIIIIRIIFLIGMRGIIGMGFAMLCNWLMGIASFKAI